MTTIDLIAANLEQHILALQQQIATRPEGQQFPTVQEVNQQCKLINCLIKLRKPAPKQSVKDNEPEQAATAPNVPVTTALSQPVSQKITPNDFKTYGHYLARSGSVGKNGTIKFNGRMVNSRWLEYNLFQYCLPPAERRFIDDARQVIAETDHAAIQSKIREHLANREQKAA